MIRDVAPDGTINFCPASQRTVIGRREALVALSAITVALTARTSSAADVINYPLWIVEAGRGRVYLLGHTPPRATDWQDARIEKLLLTCGAVWNETNHTADSNVQELVQRYGMDPKKQLRARLSTTERDRLSQAAKTAGVPEESMAEFRPWLAGQVLEGAFFSASGFSGRNADQVLVSKAGEAGLSLSGEFATQEDAARWLSELTPVQEVQYLLYILDEILTGHEKGQRIYAAWAAGKDARAADWVAGMKQRYPDLYRSLVVERNSRWIPRIQSMLTQQKAVIVVVGLYHLVGPDSIQAQLNASGLVARRI
jgi:uncharacterized protein